MKAIINTLSKSNNITQERILINRTISRFSNTKEALWNGVKRYSY